MTPANHVDITQLPALLRAEDAVVFGDAGYTSDSYRRGARALGMRGCVNDKRKAGHGNLSNSQRKRKRRHSRIRAQVEHLFRIIKCQFGYRKVRYKGLGKNRAQVMSLMAMANIYLLRKQGRLNLRAGFACAPPDCGILRPDADAALRTACGVDTWG